MELVVVVVVVVVVRASDSYLGTGCGMKLGAHGGRGGVSVVM